MRKEDVSLLVVLGPTASGKTSIGVDLARRFGAEIISADSRQVYRGMDIGTGKDLADYGTDVPYHLIDIMPAGYKYNLFEYLRDFDRARLDIAARGRLPMLVGGTGLYIESALNGLRLPEVPCNPQLRRDLSEKSLDELKDMLSSMKRLHNTTDVDTAQRAIRAIEIETYYLDHTEMAEAAKPHPLKNAVVIGVDISREERRQRISARLEARISEGMADEVRRLLESGIKPEDLIYYGLEYKYLTLYVTGQMEYRQMLTELEIAIHQFAKRQMTWFRGMERRGFRIKWLPHDMPRDEFAGAVLREIESAPFVNA